MRGRNTKNEVTLTNIKSRPIEKIIIKKDGKEISVKMNDAELVREAVTEIDAEIQRTGKLPQGIDGKFIQWLREAKAAVDNGQDIVNYKNMTVSRIIPDYRALKNVTD